MAEEGSKKSKRPQLKSKMKKSYQEENEDLEEIIDLNPVTPPQKNEYHPSTEQEVLKLPAVKTNYAEKKLPPTKQKNPSQSLPSKMMAGQKHEMLLQMYKNGANDFPDAVVPLPPITSTQNLNEILQTKLQSYTFKDFKEYFLEHAKLTRKIEGDANSLLTDAHLYELSQFDWPHLETIRIRACPHLTPFAMNYIQMISNKLNDRKINVNVELMLHAHSTIENKEDLIDGTMTELEPLFGKSTKTSITKVLIYHANSTNDFMVSSQKMIISQIRNSKDHSPMLLDYLSSTHDGHQVALLECANFILFKELSISFHPQIIYMVVSSVDDVLKCFLSVDCNISFSILKNQQIRLIINNKESDEQFLSNIQSQLKNISKSAHKLYSQFIDDTPEYISENDDFRRNHYLSSLLHVQTKCEMLEKKLSKDQCLIFKQNDPSLISNHLMADAVKHSKSLYTLGGGDVFSNKDGENKIFETNEPIKKFVNELITKTNEKNSDSTKTAQIYFAHKLIKDKVLDIHFLSHGKSYFISDIEWFCRTINNLFNIETHPHRKTEHILEQFKHTIGTNIHMIFKNDFKKFNINRDEMDFFRWLFSSWNIAYPISTGDQNDDNIFVLFNSISSESPVSLNSVWAESWPSDEYEFKISFHLLHPCDSSILFYLYKIFPSQKLLVASKSFILIQEGAIEILVQYHHEIGQNTSISITGRALNLNISKGGSDKTAELTNASFLYVIREYYIIIWAFLFKQDYAFKIEQKSIESPNLFDVINGNALMSNQWKHLALYHYSSAPTLTSTCSVCGLRPKANKALYNACTRLSPARYTTPKKSDISEVNPIEDQSSLLILELGTEPLSYTGRHNMRPDGCNSFEVIFFRTNNENELLRSPILSSIKIGCSMNNFDVKDDETILFEYGIERKKQPKTRDIQQSQGVQQGSFLDEIRNFGGLKGLKGARAKLNQTNESQELYNGLRLRIDILFTHKPNTYEFVFSINDIPWSRQLIKRKSTKTMFQPIIQSSGIQNPDQNMDLIIHYNKSALDKPIISTPTGNSKENPWKVGMRLEAKDRKNPNILAIANIVEVYEDNRIRINFDGWTSTFDYTVETDNSDLHPCGYWEYIQRVLYKNVNTNKVNPHFTFTRYDKPKSYDGPFSWRNYLTEINQEPVPFECFVYMQTEGMTVEYFPHGITKEAFTSLSCRHYFNVRVKYHKMNTFIQDEIVNKILCEHHMETSSPTANTSPGAVLLPTPFDISTFTYPCLKLFQNPSNFIVHLTCNHRSVSPLDSTTIVSGTHLMDTEGGRMDKTNLNMPLITICMLTAIDLARNQKRPIAPCASKLISNSTKSFDKRFIDLYMRRWLDLSAYITCFHSTYFYSKRPSVSDNRMHPSFYTCYSDQDLFGVLKNGVTSISIDSSTSSNLDKENLFGNYGECYYCCLLRSDEIKDKSDISIQKRLEMIDGYAASIFYFELHKQEKQLSDSHLILNDDFFLKFNGLEIIDIKNITIDRFELNTKNKHSLKNLTYLSLENNDLSTIQMDFQYLNKLVYLKLSLNPFESLPVNCLALKSLQMVELFELGRLTEIDPNTPFSSELKGLVITESILTTLPQTLSVDAQIKLTKLTLSGVAWWGINGMSVNEVVKYESFEKQFIPFLDSQELTAIYRMYDEDANGILSFSEINLMNAHIYRYISRLRPSNVKIPNSGRSSVDPTNKSDSDIAQQDSFVNDTSGIPSVIFSLRNLTELTLEYQGIKSVPDAIKNLTYLTIFNLNYCIELETLSAQVGFLPLKELNLNGCVSLKTPPIEITRRGHTQTMAFLQRLVSGSTACKRTKLMLVGLGGAGKTSLVRAFLESHSDTPPTVTDGIDIVKWKVPLPDDDDFLEFSVWDFAGQSVYYHTHQFFLAKKAVYVLAWNIRLGAEHAGLDFWLSSICCHAPNAPIFVVGTHSDQVSRFDLRQDDFKRRYPQIAGFFNVSTQTGDNLSDLIESIIKTALALPYMDEQIPKAWLTFESLIAECKEDILEYRQVTDVAHNAGIFDPGEILQAVQFLHDLGSLQYFSSEYLKNYVVINPQWIVNVMACIVSIKDSPVKDGRLFYSDMSEIWQDYDEHFHPWILKLTEAFDLTFPVPDQNMNLVPCLLPEEEPEYAWDDDVTDTEIKEMKIIYTFNYLPAGLFNRAQVRLFQFSDKSTIWRYGSLLVKNNHRAVIIRTDDRHIVIKIQGVRPDNILFLIHEVFEGLVNESFFGVTYDIAFPCPDCVELGTNEPWQFSSSLINRAIELKSPSIQCHRFFHVASITNLQALIPPDSKSNYDLHLEYSVRDLKSYKQNMAVDVVYIYPPEHIPTSSEIDLKTDPRKIKEDLTKRGLKVWAPESMKEFKIENHYLVVKEAGFIIFGISTELIQNSDNKNLYDAYQTITNILRKPIIPVLFGTDMKWKESDIGVELSDKLYVNMQNPKRYEHRINELVDLIEHEKSGQNKTEKLRDQPTDIFISYCWSNSHDAVIKGTKPTPTSIGWGDPRVVKDYLEERGLSVWMDITRLGKSGVLHDIVQGLKSTKLVIACVSDEYTQSEVCRNEFLFAKNTLRLPVVLAIFGSGDKWRITEVGMCSLTCPQVNFQFENPSAFEDVYSLIQSNLPKQSSSIREAPSNVVTTPGTEEKTTAAYQELFELTQRKFLRLISGFAETMTARAYPRLFACDFMGEKEKSAQELARIEMATEMNAQRQQENEANNERDLEAERQRDEEVRRKQEDADATTKSKEKETVKEKAKPLCIRALCENEENWHPAGIPFEITEKVIIQNSASYLSRIMLLLKHSDLALEILNSDEGEIELQKLNEITNTVNIEVKDSYAYLRRCIMDFDLEEKYCGLKLCLMPSGKVLWLCEEHQNQPRVILVTGSVAGGYTRPQVEEKSEIVKALAKLNERIANNELPPPALKVPSIGSVRRLSSEKQSYSNRSSRRFSRQESILIKPQQQNILEIDENVQENDDENIQISADEADIEHTNKKQDQTSVGSTDCSIM